MNSFFCGVLLLAWIATVSASCHSKIRCYENKVNELVNEQIGVELKGHYTYLYLSYHFLQHDRYYPKVSKYFREKSDEEMQHAERFIQYQNQRGGTFNIGPVNRKTDGHCNDLQTLKQGFACAKELEMDVTRALTKLLSDVSDVPKSDNCHSIPEANRDLVLAQPILVTYNNGEETVTKHLYETSCEANSFEKVEYVELGEMIAHEFLGHQIEDTKELANFEATLKGFGSENEKLGSFLADKKFDL